MRLFWLTVLPLACCLTPGIQAEDEQLTADTLPRFLSGYDQTLQQVDSAFAEILNQKLPLLDDSGKPLLHRNVEDRHKQVAELRDRAKQLATAPQDLVLVLKISDGTEKLADEVYDFSQIALNNDFEELADRLSRLLPEVDRNQDALEAYALSLAGEREKHINELERELQELQQKLKGSAEKKETQRPR
jgi:hypothetical protein